jgi:hypothetical protein
VQTAAVFSVLVQYKHSQLVLFADFQVGRRHKDLVFSEDLWRHDVLTINLIMTNLNSAKIDKKFLRGFVKQFEIHSDLATIPIAFR